MLIYQIRNEKNNMYRELLLSLVALRKYFSVDNKTELMNLRDVLLF